MSSREHPAAQGRDEAAAVYAALRRSGAGCPAFWKAMEKAKAKGRQFVVYEETGEEREVVGYCRACRATPDEDVMLVSPQGVAHHAAMDTTDCGHNATGPDWWWRT